MFLPEPAKSRSRTKWRPLSWGRGRTPRAEQAPPPQARTLPVPSPRVSGPDRLRFSPPLQLEVVNCSHCPEGTDEVPGSVLAQGAFCSPQPLQPGMEVPFPQKPDMPVRPQWLQTPRKRGQGSGMPEGRCPDVFDLFDRFPTLLRPLRSCETTARLEAGDTHRPELPVWASCRMRCSCLFIILGPGWEPSSHLGGWGWQPPAQPASPRASPRMGGRRSGFLGRRAPLAGAGAGAGALLPRSRLRPRPPGHSFLQVWSLALSLLPGLYDPRGCPTRLPSVRRSVSLRSTVECGLFPSRTLPSRRGGWREAGKLLLPPPPWV